MSIRAWGGGGDVRLGIGRKIILDDDGDTYWWVSSIDDRWTLVSGGVSHISFNGVGIVVRDDLSPNVSGSYDLGNSGQTWRNAFIDTLLSLGETTTPTGVANKGLLYTKDNGAGKTQLCVIFGTGAEQVLATEP